MGAFHSRVGNLCKVLSTWERAGIAGGRGDIYPEFCDPNTSWPMKIKRRIVLGKSLIVHHRSDVITDFFLSFFSFSFFSQSKLRSHR